MKYFVIEIRRSTSRQRSLPTSSHLVVADAPDETGGGMRNVTSAMLPPSPSLVLKGTVAARKVSSLLTLTSSTAIISQPTWTPQRSAAPLGVRPVTVSDSAPRRQPILPAKSILILTVRGVSGIPGSDRSARRAGVAGAAVPGPVASPYAEELAGIVTGAGALTVAAASICSSLETDGSSVMTLEPGFDIPESAPLQAAA
mmetsp:Transcript_21462/g.49460  ORF Transcript_21462/g.49460 Transcript_21462/m.49460 type:complete len:200 (-) Transcript_21462:317-916(-)|eukprot:CAMPEP_0182570210 /NCGR_PEP_ID=MMETSP1324-20130603/10598_1 /TAXON_ID=236786 /ORGANISM="Florenciella sp., Strain RCC1587" /LENGTH=199 /DNA_ID=CAMNT_0024784577 /DNA_START=1049 /DNA_END=1648 /DNA_ORIENTATION=+